MEIHNAFNFEFISNLVLIAFLIAVLIYLFLREEKIQARDKLNDYVEKLEGITTELMEARIISEQASQAKNAFLANMSHELRTPLNGIIGNVSLLLQTDITEKQERYLVRIKTASQILMDIIGQVLDFSKLAAGEIKLESVASSLSDIFKECYEVLIARAEEKKIAFEINLPEEVLPEVLASPIRLKQVLINILGNAIKFTEKGSVRMDVSVLEKDGDHLKLRIAISDTGIGLSPENLSHLFERFWQADSSNTRKYGGTGLGLAYSKEIIDLMGGSIRAESTEGQGTCFTLEIPFQTTAKLVAEKH